MKTSHICAALLITSVVARGAVKSGLVLNTYIQGTCGLKPDAG